MIIAVERTNNYENKKTEPHEFGFYGRDGVQDLQAL